MRFFVVTIFMMMMCNMCMAQTFGSDRAAIGGITAGARADYIRSIYGDPTSIGMSEDKIVETWLYGDSFLINLVGGKAVIVTSSGNNGLFTPDGIGVGMKAKVVKKTYGKPVEMDKCGKRAIYTYNVDGGSTMYFVIRNGFISEIRLFTH